MFCLEFQFAWLLSDDTPTTPKEANGKKTEHAKLQVIGLSCEKY